MRVPVVIAAAFLACVSQSAFAGEVAGTVYDAEGLPAANVQLEIADSELRTVSAADGTFRFADLADGKHRIAVNYGARAVQYVPFKVAGDAPVKRNVYLLAGEIVDDMVAEALPTESIMEEALDLSEQMTRELASREAIEWRWRDSDG